MSEEVFFREELDDKYFRNVEAIVKDVKSYAVSNFEYYKGYDDDYSLRFVRSFSFLLEYLNDGLLPGIKYVLSVGRSYDYSENHPGNGYRSLVKLVQKCCLHILTLSRHVSNKRSSVFFRNENHSKELEAFVNMLGQLKACLYYAHKYSQFLTSNLIIDEFNKEMYSVMLEIENLSQEPFFGYCLGFQFCASMQQPLNMMHLVLACYSEGYQKPTAFMKVAASLLHSGKFYLSPELRAKKVVSATLDGDITFCKSFWSLSENNLMHSLSKFVSPTVALETTFNIPTDPITVCLANDPSKTITVHPSSAHGDPLPLPVRLISYSRRKGQMKSYSPKAPSDYLVIHCHGGGFVAQSSLSHASYLRHWAKDLDVPIVSIDYSLAPEYAYPRQVEEIFFAYCWILNNLQVLGSTGKTIVFVGDSAGGNLVLSTALRTLEKGVRKPDGILCVYGCFLVRYTPTPSRLLSLSDPVLPVGNLTNCLAAYIGIDVRLKEESYKKRRLQRQQNKQILQNKLKSELVIQGSDEGKNNNSKNGNEEVNNNNTDDKKPSKMRKGFKRFFKNNTFDFMKKQNHYTLKKPSKSCEFEDLRLNSSKKTYSFDTQKSLLNESSSPDALKKDIRLTKSEKLLIQNDIDEDEEPNDNNNNKMSNIDDEGEYPTGHGKKSSFVIKRRDDEEDENDNSRKDVLCSLKDDNTLTGSSESTKVAAKSSTALLNEATTTATTPSEEAEEDERMMEDAEEEMKKLDQAIFPDCAILGHRRILLDTKALHKQLERTQDMYLSPVFAPDSALKELNCISFVALHLDPLLDESIYMAKRFKAVGAQVSLELVDDLPHGFLNLMHLSKEAYQASLLCGLKLRRLLAAGRRNRLTSESSLSNISFASDSELLVNVNNTTAAATVADATVADATNPPTIARDSSNESVSYNSTTSF